MKQRISYPLDEHLLDPGVAVNAEMARRRANLGLAQTESAVQSAHLVDGNGFPLGSAASTQSTVPTKPALAGFALSIGLASLIWRRKLYSTPQIDPFAPKLLPPLDPPPSKVAAGATRLALTLLMTGMLTSRKPLAERLVPARRLRVRKTGHSPSIFSGLAVAVGLASLLVAYEQRSRLQDMELVPASSQTLLSVLQQNAEAHRQEAERALQAGTLPTEEERQGILQHLVRPGETLWQLTQMYQLDAAAITIPNGITARDALRPGQELWIPSEPGLIYTIKSGDTLETVANRYQVEQSEIIRASQLTQREFLRPGQRLLIPGDLSKLLAQQQTQIASQKAQAEERQLEQVRQKAEAEARRQEQEEARKRAEVRNDKGQLVYTVRPGDTVEGIAARYMITQEQIIRLNQLRNPGRLSLGQRLLLTPPKPAQPAPKPTIKPDPTPRAAQPRPIVRPDPTPQAAQPRPIVRPDPTPQAAQPRPIVRPDPTPQAAQPRPIVRPDPTPQPTVISRPEQARTISTPEPARPIPSWKPSPQPTLQMPDPEMPPPVENPPEPRPAAESTPQPKPTLELPEPEMPPHLEQPRQRPPSPQARVSSDRFIWPVSGSLGSPFGWRRGRIHAGIDIPGPVGSPIAAVLDGVVIHASYGRDGYGNRVDIRHANGLVTRYAHGSQIFVSVGQQVQQGQVIMSRGSTGWSTGPHLHFEVRPGGGAAVDPMPYFR